MIDELDVHDVALIREARLEPAEGLTVLTGETGAGKSALLSAVKLLMGERADAGAVREGAGGLSVEGRFFLRGGDPDGVVVSRAVGADGRGRVRIDGHAASVRELAEGVGATIDLCGQHEHQRLLRKETHVDLLDAWGREAIEPVRQAYVRALGEARSAGDDLRRVRQLSEAADSKVEEAAFVLDRINEVDPQEGEYEELEESLPKAEHAEALLRAAAGAHEGLAGDEGVCDVLSALVQELRDAGRFDEGLDRLADGLESSLIDLEDTASELRRYQDSVDLDQESLAAMQERMSRLQGLLRTYGPRMQEVFAHRDRARELVESARDGGRRVRAAQEAQAAAESRLKEAADALDAARAAAAPQLGQAISQQMRFLEMGSAQLEVVLDRLPRKEWGDSGPSRVELMYRPAAGLTPRPLRKIASGGEISRVMLACKVVLGEADGTETLVFDEVDAGVGGTTALALAQVLANLARSHQVIVVTHLAQVAVMADRHYLVSKTAGDLPQTSLDLIEGDARVAEVARLLSGDASEVSLAHARQMLDQAGHTA